MISNKKLKSLLESTKHFMNPQEIKLKKDLALMLIKNNHSKYAERFLLFDVNIVPLKLDPDFTAAASFDEATIYISEGFLSDPTTFYQLDMLLRHEISHNILMHQIRFMHMLGDELDIHWRSSMTMHEIENILMDFEISNTRYSDADKKIVRHTWLNGQEFSGLVTEDSRPGWEKLSLEEMFNKFLEEEDILNKAILDRRHSDIETTLTNTVKNIEGKKSDIDMITHSMLTAAEYTGTAVDIENIGTDDKKVLVPHVVDISNRPSRFIVDIQDFIKGVRGYIGGYNPQTGAILYSISEFAPQRQELIIKLNEICSDTNCLYNDKNEVSKLIKNIGKSKLTEIVTVEKLGKDGKTNLDPNNSLLLVTPEEKGLAIEVLKRFSGIISKLKPEDFNKKATIVRSAVTHSKEYYDAYNELIEILDDENLSDDELLEIAKRLGI